MKYGYFDDTNREYIITNPKTPVKWINYVGTLAFDGFVDQTGGALICKSDPTYNRITKYITQLPASDFKGEGLYLRIKTPGVAGYLIFSPFYVPCLVPYEKYECHVGLGYTRIVSQVMGIETEVTIFVPRDAACEVRRIRVTNRSGEPVEADLIPVVEYTHFNALLQLTNADWVPQTMQSAVVEQAGGQKVLQQYAFMRKDSAVNYFTSSHAVDSFDTDRRAFLGDNEYGSWASPRSLQQPSLSNSVATRGDNIAALLHRLGVLEPDETREIITILGQEASLAEAQPIIEKYSQPVAVEAALEAQKVYWEEVLSNQQVNTPDPAFNTMLNVHNPHQCYITLNWSRYLSYYQLGYGSRGIGFRDSSQDVMGALALVPNDALALIRKLLLVQKRNGSAMHQFNPLTMVGSEGDSLEREDRPHYYSDDHLWIVQAVTAYIKETGDFAFLQEVIPYYEKDRDELPIEAGSVLDHLVRAVEFTRRDVGQHDLPLLGFADWNDTVNLAKGAESLLTANLYGTALRELIDLAAVIGDAALAERCKGYYEDIKATINEQGWDGEWYRAYYDADGTPLGSKQNAAGQIYTYAQAWPVISGLATPDRAQSALNSVEKLLNTRNGIKLSAPGFNGFDPAKGGITTYPPGAKENGGIFLHVNPWVIIAEALTGNSERAYRYYQQINPAAKNDAIDEFECEPYVYPQNILGDEHPLFGLARNSWLSGTASWMYQAGTRYIAGIQPTYEGLRIDPCIPASWEKVEISRRFRGVMYNITIRNPNHVAKGVKEVRVDGEIISGNVLTTANTSGRHRVEVLMG